LIALGSIAFAQNRRSAMVEVVLHEPIPGEDSLMAGPSTAPVFVFEEGDEEGIPSVIRRDGVELPAPPPDLNDTGDDLVYRTADPTAAPEDGTVHNVQNEVRPDRETDREPWLRYHAVFDPAIIPFKRNSSKDRVTADGAIVTGDPALRPEALVGNRASAGREVFWGSVLLELQAGSRVPLPSVSPESRILSYETVPEAKLTFYKDGADNFFADPGDFSGRVRVNFVMDAPATWFAQPARPNADWSQIPTALRPQLPERFVSDVKRVARTIGVQDSDSYSETLGRLVYWFRNFAPGELDKETAGIYVDLALGQKGVCRHRAYGFVITAHGLGIPARYVSNEAHVFVEVFIPGGGWLRIDLGGGAEGMDVRNGKEKTRHSVAGEDPFGFPPGFTGGYSQRALDEEPSDGADDGDPVRGLPPRPGVAGRNNGMPGFPGSTSNRLTQLGNGEDAQFLEEPDKVSSKTTLDQVSAQVFRGDKMQLIGEVESDGRAVSGGVVRILLMDSDRRSIIAELGTAKTLPNGRYSASIVVPRDVDLGTWEVVAEFIGDAVNAPSHSD
jgi:hypothetical protein